MAAVVILVIAVILVVGGRVIFEKKRIEKFKLVAEQLGFHSTQKVTTPSSRVSPGPRIDSV